MTSYTAAALARSSTRNAKDILELTDKINEDVGTLESTIVGNKKAADQDRAELRKTIKDLVGIQFPNF